MNKSGFVFLFCGVLKRQEETLLQYLTFMTVCV